MQVTVEKTGPCQAKVQFTVPGDEFSGKFKLALQNAGKNAKLKGFRPGHVPIQIIEKHYGVQLRQETVQYYFQQAYEQAIKDNQLKVVGFQRVNLDEVRVLEGADFVHAFEVSLRPEIVLGNYKGLEIESQLEPVMDVEIDNAVENLKLQQSQPEPAGDLGLPANGMALAKVEWVHEGVVILTRDGLRVSPASPTPGTDPEAFKTALTGAKDGETREVPMTFPPDFDKVELRGKQGATRVTVSQAYKLNPPSDEDLRKLLGVADDAAMKKLVKEKLAEAKTTQEHGRVENVILDMLLGTHTFDLPAMMVEEQTNARIAQLKQQMQQGGVAADQIEQQAASQKENAVKAAERGIRALFLMQVIGEKENLLVTREDMQAEVHSIAQRNNAKVEEVVEYYQKNNLLDQMAIEILERKVRRFLRENAKIKEPA
ncbi:MAG: trigger factor [Planctomycetes bacterium]|nr:trigger factor [Planctomycetota bacterium]